MDEIATSYILVWVFQDAVLDTLNVIEIVFPRTRPDADDLPWPDRNRRCRKEYSLNIDPGCLSLLDDVAFEENLSTRGK